MIPENLNEVEFTLSCTEITFPDRRYRYFPQIRLYIREQGDFMLYDQTEVVRGTKSPVFQQNFKVPCNSGVALTLKFELVDSRSPEDQKFIGQAIIPSEELLRTPEHNKIIEIMSLTYKVCDLNIQWRPPANPSKDLLMTVEGVDLKYHMAWFSKPEIKPFFRLGRWMSGDDFLYVYESIVHDDPKNPKWKAFKAKTSNLSKGDSKSPIKLRVFYYENRSEKLLGECTFTIDQILHGHTLVSLDDKVKQKSVGTMRIKCQMLEKISSLDENKFESKLNVVMGIDFSDTQRRLQAFNSTHAKQSAEALNPYQTVIHELFHLLYELNGHQGIPTYGFGRLKASSSSKSRKEENSPGCFSLTGNASNPWVSNLNEMSDAYNKHLLNNVLGGQSNFSEIINRAIYLAKYNKLRNSKEYVVLILITDGSIQDFENTLNSIIQAANAPLSIIMIGVGDGDFESFETLDSQLGLYDTARRDYVSFFAFKDFEGDINKLKEKFLQDIPEQILEYIETEHTLLEESKDRHKEVPAYIKEDLYKIGREYTKAKKQIDSFTRRPVKQK